ncbi:histone chaperone asf1b-B-like [Anneissia japonica]|uniref:histone chaperone asf1b-B-like n=1 Tax=Anneissia japonica TaxID=1529436 RepID=UPI0014255861|nr:histone chaperone asf1b-B-like [Anneissia japonica]XP_033096893.1 histone chaperone asf1b-B-like [Anneissia japonica]
MAKVQITNVRVLDNPASFLNPFQFEITFECLEDLPEDLEWKIIYVGSAESEDNDQVLDTVLVGPVPAGNHMFVFQANAPDIKKIPIQDLLGVTVTLITCSYRTQEFVRVGYYVNNEYDDQEMNESPPSNPEYDKILRNILETNPRVTRFTIDWEQNPNSENIPPASENQQSSSSQMNGVSCTDVAMEKLSNDVSVSADSNSSLPEYVSAMQH